MKKAIFLVLALSSVSAFAKLSAIKETTTASCQEVIHAVRHNGYLYLTVNGLPKAPHLKAYYADGSWCAGSERAEQAWLPTASGPSCPVGFTCVDKR